MKKEENIIKEFCIKTGNNFEEILEAFKNGLTKAEQKEVILEIQKELNFSVEEFLLENEFEFFSRWYDDSKVYRRSLGSKDLYVVFSEDLEKVYIGEVGNPDVFLSNVNTFDKLVNLVMVLF